MEPLDGADSERTCGHPDIYRPRARERAPVDNRLHEVTASTMTLQQPANTVASFGGIGGSFFNLIDVAQGYVFDPSELKIISITRLANGHIVLQCLGVPNQLNSVQASPDLIIPFTNLASMMANVTGAFQYEDMDAGNFTKRFYRLAFP